MRLAELAHVGGELSDYLRWWHDAEARRIDLRARVGLAPPARWRAKSLGRRIISPQDLTRTAASSPFDMPASAFAPARQGALHVKPRGNGNQPVENIHTTNS
jgi:hypothetical protein